MPHDDLDRKIALSIEPMPTSYDQTTPCFSPLRAWYRKSGPGKEPTWWQHRSMLEPEMNNMLWKKLLDKLGWKHAFMAVFLLADSTEPGSLRDNIRCVELSELWEEAVRITYARAEGLK